jgi:hypothetical protein
LVSAILYTFPPRSRSIISDVVSSRLGERIGRYLERRRPSINSVTFLSRFPRASHVQITPAVGNGLGYPSRHIAMFVQ